jgi:hypothetical protein
MAGFSIDIRFDTKDVERELNRWQREVIPKAAAAALNKVAATIEVQTAREISKTTGMGVRTIKEKIAVHRAGPAHLIASIEGFAHAPNLIRYGARQTKQGVSANAWNKRKIYKHTFIANQGRTVFARVGKARLPIKPIYGPSVRKEFERARALMKTVAEQRWGIEFERAVRLYLARQAGGL